MRQNLLTGVLLFFSVKIIPQNLDKIGEKGAFTMNGSIQTNSNYIFNINTASSSLNTSLSGLVNMQVLDLNFPFSFNYLNNSFSTAKPLQMIAVHPSYKNIKTHLGRFTYNLDPMVFSGKIIEGFGIDLNTENHTIGLLMGRLNKLNKQLINANEKLSYLRKAFAFQYHFKLGKREVKFDYFISGDDYKSDAARGLAPVVLPEENEIIHLKYKENLLSFLNFESEFYLSRYSFNAINMSGTSKMKFPFIIRINEDTRKFSAVKLNAHFHFRKNNTKIFFEKIDPGYKSLGLNTVADDRLQVLLTSAQSMFNNKVNIQLNSTFQTNNLNNKKSENNFCVQEVVSANLRLASFFNFQSNYSYTINSSSASRFWSDFRFWDWQIPIQFSQQIISCSFAFNFTHSQNKNEVGLIFSETKNNLRYSGAFTQSGNLNFQAYFSLKRNTKTGMKINLIYSAPIPNSKILPALSCILNLNTQLKRQSVLTVSFAARSTLKSFNQFNTRINYQKGIKLNSKKENFRFTTNLVYDVLYLNYWKSTLNSQIGLIYSI